MTRLKKDSWFTVVVLVLIALILGEIGFLGYQFWFKPIKSCQESLVFPSPFPCASPSSVSASPVTPFIQLFFGWLERATAEEVTLRTEEGRLVTFPLAEVEFFSFRPEKEEPLSLLAFFDPDFEGRPGAELLMGEDVKPGSPVYVIVERTANNLYLGRRLVVIRE